MKKTIMKKKELCEILEKVSVCKHKLLLTHAPDSLIKVYGKSPSYFTMKLNYHITK